MEKSILNLGRVLNRAEQKQINGSARIEVFRTPCIAEESGGKCCYTVDSHITDDKVDNWVKEKICI